MSDHDVRPPVQALSARETARPLDATLYEGVPAHLQQPLRSWVISFVGSGLLADRVAAILRIATDPASFAGPQYSLADADGGELLDIIDAALQLDERLQVEIGVLGLEQNEAAIIAHNQSVLPGWLLEEYRWPTGSTRARAVEELDQLLRDGGSAYQVDWSIPVTLTRRVDPTVTAAFEHTLTAAPPSAAELLHDAWRRVYGRHPDPSAAYRQAVRAVEEIACPLVLATSAANNTATLGTVRNHLRDAPDKWHFVLLDRDGGGSVDPLVAMLDRLWTGQVSRHGGGSRSRDQTRPEAEAAVHLAATLVQWLSSDVLTRQDTP